MTQTKLKCNIEEKLQKSQEKDKAMIEKLQEEISQLQIKHSELEELSQSDDHLHLLQVSQHSNSYLFTSSRIFFLLQRSLCLTRVVRKLYKTSHNFI